MSNRGSTSGVIYVHSSPSAVCPHVEWAISGALGVRTELRWTAQPAAPGQLRAECAWTGEPGTGARVVSALRAWPMLRFEVTWSLSETGANAPVEGEVFTVSATPAEGGATELFRRAFTATYKTETVCGTTCRVYDGR